MPIGRVVVNCDSAPTSNPHCRTRPIPIESPVEHMSPLNAPRRWREGDQDLPASPLRRFFQSYPPAGKKLGDVFQANVIPNRIDATYSNIVANFKRLEQANPGKTDYANLTEAIGTNDIARYFPNLVDAKEELNPEQGGPEPPSANGGGKNQTGH